ncbi:MAG: hypothetical protein ABI306_03645 [Caulobacteraceae bacterium]
MKPEPLTPLEPRIAEVVATIADEAQRALFQRVVAGIDVDAHRRLQEIHAAATLKSAPGFIYKYMDVCYWIKDKVARVFSMGLVNAPPARILDLGTGGGHFLAVCNVLGHETIGLDLEVPLYVELCALMGVDRRTYRVESAEPLPSNLGKFDLITAFQIKFDALGVDAKRRYVYWSLADWRDFIHGLTSERMRYPGRLFLDLNSRVLPDNTREPFMDVIAACRAAGAGVLKANSELQFHVHGPVSLDPGPAENSRAAG